MARPDKVITYLRMTNQEAIRPGREARSAITTIATRSESALRPIYDALANTWDWPDWDEWKVGFTRPRRHFYLLAIDERPAGLAKFIDHGGGEIQVDTFGLASDFVGRGYGGAALTRMLELAWHFALRDSDAGLVWLHTCNWDHPHALQNYLSRGFEIVRSEPVAESEARGFTCPTD
jgi:GNAT superfamily N-acetyltransferase